MRSGVIRTRVRSRRCWRMISWPAAKGMRWVNPSIASVSPSCTTAAMPSDSETISAMVTDQHVRVAHTRTSNLSVLIRAFGACPGGFPALTRMCDALIQRTWVRYANTRPSGQCGVLATSQEDALVNAGGVNFAESLIARAARAQALPLLAFMRAHPGRDHRCGAGRAHARSPAEPRGHRVDGHRVARPGIRRAPCSCRRARAGQRGPSRLDRGRSEDAQ